MVPRTGSRLDIFPADVSPRIASEALGADNGIPMRAISYSDHGPADEVLKLVEIPTPEPDPGEVRVRIFVSGVNPTDWKQRAGTGAVESGFQIPNQDGAGIIDLVGSGVSPERVGQRVWVYFAAWQRQGGTAAEYLCLPETQAVPLPDSASFDLGASLGIPALTAHRALFADGPIDDAMILVTGGAGAVGHAAIQLGRRAGARIITTVSSTAKAEVAEAAGAHTVINYKDPDTIDQIRATAPDGINRIIDVAPTANTDITTAVLDPDGTIVTYANDGPLPLMAHMQANTTIRFVLVYTMGTAAIDAAVNGTSEAVADGTLRTLPITRFSLEEAAAAHDAVEKNTLGKILIAID